MGLIVKNSKIKGKGIFTDCYISKGSIVLKWNLETPLDNKGVSELTKEELCYLESVNGKTYLIGEPERYMNHSCESNTNPIEQCDIAVRDILTGEEITSDYRKSNSNQDFNCLCGSKICEKRIKTVIE